MRTRSTSLKACVIRYIHNRDGRPCYLNEIYASLAKERGKENNENFKAQIRGVLNASIKKKENIFQRVHGIGGLYALSGCKTEFDKYIEEIEKNEEREKNCKDDVITRDEALAIYNQYINFAYSEANKMHGSSCIVPLEELQSISQIGLFKGACEFRPSRAKNDGKSPIPFLKSYIRGHLLNLIREQKTWNSRNVRVESGDAIDSLNVRQFDDLPDDKSNDVTQDLSIRQLRDVLIQQMKAHLNGDEFVVMSKRWGLDGEGGKTYKQVGKEVCNGVRKCSDDSAKSWSWQVERNARQKLSRKSPVLRELFKCHRYA